MSRSLILILLTISYCTRALASRSDTGSVYFIFNKSDLTEVSKARIDKMLYDDLIDDLNPVSIIGYADYVGGEEYNLDLSKRRANAVKEYLVKSGFRPASISIIIGKGKVPREDLKDVRGYAPDRRVDIVRGTAQSATNHTKHDTVAAILKTSIAGTKLSTIAVNQTIKLNKLFFYAGRHTIREDSGPALMDLYQTMLTNPTLKIRIEGHVCCIRAGVPDALDEDSGGLVLSTNRARAIQDWLIAKGIARNRLSYKGFGKSKPVIQSETTEEEADLNRRVEIRIVEK